MDMSNVVIQNWKSWDSYDTITSTVENAEKEIVSQSFADVSSNRSVMTSTPRQEEAEPSNLPFLAIGGTTAYDKDTSLIFENIEDETKACMDLLQGTLKRSM